MINMARNFSMNREDLNTSATFSNEKTKHSYKYPANPAERRIFQTKEKGQAPKLSSRRHPRIFTFFIIHYSTWNTSNMQYKQQLSPASSGRILLTVQEIIFEKSYQQICSILQLTNPHTIGSNHAIIDGWS